MPVDMRDSDTYLAILEEGQEKEAKKLILLQGQNRFGVADEAIKTKLNAITDLERLERLSVKLLQAATWQELLDTP